MNTIKKTSSRIRRALPLFVFLAGLGLSGAASWWLHQAVDTDAKAEFGRGADRIESEVARRFRQPIYGLNGAKGVYAASASVERAEFRAYVDSRKLASEFPGVRGLGFIQAVKRENLAGFVAAERADGAPLFKVIPLEEPDREVLYVIKFIEPLAANAPAVGVDVASEARRRAGAELAIDTGEAAITEAISLVQADKMTPGVLLYVPVYAQGAPIHNVAERRAGLRGLVYAPIVIQELLEGMPDVQTGQFDFELFDVASGTPADRLIFDADKHLAGLPPGNAGSDERQFQTSRAVILPGRTLHLQISSTPQFEARVQNASPALLLAGGLLASVLLSLLVWQQTSGRRRAEVLAGQMTSDLDRLALVARKTSNAVIITDAGGRITWVNEGFERISGYTALEALGQSPGRLLQFEETDPQVTERMRQALTRGESFNGEVLNRGKNGNIYWLQLEIQPLRDGTGTLTGFMAIESDITDQKRADSELRAMQSELRRSNEVLNSVLENMPCGLSVFDGDLHLVASNTQLRDMLQLPDALFSPGPTRFEDIIAFNAARGEYGAGDLEAKVKEIITHARAPASPHRFERVRPDGTTLEVRGGPLPGGGFVSTYTDISDRKKAEQDLRRSDLLLRGAMNAIDEGFVLYGPDDRLVFCNEKYRQIYADVADLLVPGALFEDIIRASALKGSYPAAVGRVEEWVAERLAIHRTRSHVSLEQTLSSGRILRIVEQRMPDGHVVGFRFDITELVRSRENALQASVAKSQFLANMSHELRTPMNAILGMLALLGNTGLSPRQADYTAKSEVAARSLLALLNEILDFSKIEAGKMSLDPRPFRVDQLLRDLAVILTTNVGSKQIEMLFDIDPQLPRSLVGDALRLQQILINLCSNAIKFTDHGEVVLSVVVKQLEPAQVTLTVSVRDTGIGIAPENQARIFSGFTQAEASTTRRFGGTGLGVAISQRFVTLMGGELQLESALGEGSRFFFTLSLPVDTAAASEISDPPRLDPAALPTLASPWRALVVDDHPTARAVLIRMGQSLGWTVDVAESGERALALLEAGRQAGTGYQAVLVDWQMPGLDGWTTCQRIRQYRLAGGAPVLVMVTAHSRELMAQRNQTDRTAIDGFLIKPITASGMFDAVIHARSAHNQPHPSRPLTSSPGQRLSGLRLLLVEDNLLNQQVASELLQNEGASVQIANQGQEAVDALIAAPSGFDVVLMDLQMPVMDGLVATRHIREVLGLTLPIVAMTANAMSSDREACLAVGMNEHVGKPFDLNQLVRLLRRLGGLQEVPTEGSSGSEEPLGLAVAAAARAARVDIDAALARMGGKQAVYQRMLRSFMNDLAALPGQLADLVARGEVLSVSRSLHTLKGLSATLGATNLAAQAAQSEKDLSGENAASLLEAVVQQVRRAVAAALPELQALQTALQSDQVPQSAPGPAVQLNSGALIQALQAMDLQLRNADMAATEAMTNLSREFGPALGEPLQELDEAVGQLDFERASRLCQELIARQAP